MRRSIERAAFVAGFDHDRNLGKAGDNTIASRKAAFESGAAVRELRYQETF